MVAVLLGTVALTTIAAQPAAAADAPRRSGHDQPVRVAVEIRRAGVLRVRDHAAVLHVAMRCSEDATGEVDAVLEQRTREGLQRATRSFDIPCGARWRPLELVFERAHFVPGRAHLVLDAMAGFAEQFGQTESRVGAVLTPTTR